MKLIFLGTGSAFTVGANNYQSNALIVSDSGKRLLLDCGTDIRLSLFEQNFTHKDIDAVYVSHLHADHVGGLEWLAFTKYFIENKKKAALYISDSLLEKLWEHVLSGGLSSLPEEEATLSHYFDVKPVANGHVFEWEKIKFHLIPTIHTISNHQLLPSYGLFMEANKKKILFTTDSCFAPETMMKYYKEASIIFHDCETSPVKSCVHATYADLKSLPEDIKSKMWLYHYSPGVLPDAVKDGFCGFAKKGQVFNF